MLTRSTHTTGKYELAPHAGKASADSGVSTNPVQVSHRGRSRARRDAREAAPMKSAPGIPLMAGNQMFPIMSTMRAVSGSSSKVSLNVNAAAIDDPTAISTNASVARTRPPT